MQPIGRRAGRLRHVKYVGAGTVVAFIAVQFRPASGKAPEAWYRATSRWRRARPPGG